MRNLLESQFGLFLLWAALLGVFIFVRPPSESWLFWALLTVVFFVVAIYLSRSYLESKSLKESIVVWRHRLDSLVDIMDVKDDGHLYEWFDPSRIGIESFLSLNVCPKVPGTCVKLLKS